MRVSSATLSAWYAQVATCLEAGLSLQRAIETIPGPPEQARARLRDALAAGLTIEQALATGGEWLPEIDRQLIVAGASAGRVADMMRRLSVKHEQASKAARRALAAALYPLFVAHFAVFALPFGLLINGPGLGAYLLAVVKILVPFWLVTATGIFAIRRHFRPVTTLLDALPWIGGYRWNRAVADLAFVLEAQVVAGIRLDVAWLQAAMAAGDNRLEPIALAVAEGVQRGESVSLILKARRSLPSPFPEFWENGERTGQLDMSLGHLNRHFNEVAGRKLATASFVYPKLLFALVAIWIAAQVVRFYGGYFHQFEELLQ